MQDFEKMGIFYLGKEYDVEQKQLQEEMVLYKSKNLTTHGVLIGMTGSGKTGLGIGIIEEAAIDNIPVIAIDPKGDLTNLALTFPQLRGEDFCPWINLQEAASKGIAPDEYAQQQADSWKKGLGDWGQDGQRIQRFQDAADVVVYTPGSSAGRGVSVLKSFDPPPVEVLNDKDALRDRIQITATSLLSLIGLGETTAISREHILVSTIIEYAWSAGQSLSLSDLINAIQTPPVQQVGVMDMESFFPAKERFSLAMALNNLLASPSFQAWLEGEAMDINRFLYGEGGKPRISVFSVAHLSDSERMFFVTMLLNEILSWVRTQPGTGSLRALLYMDELFGYLPPTANPPSKTPLLTLLKQARAYGLGLLLSTQNPVDLDYKALSNAGTWFIGRLQTERDKERVLAGLEGAALGGDFNKQRTEQILAGLGQRVFYLHSVHEDAPVVFSTRWVLSYLAGPLTREQIASLPTKHIQDEIKAEAAAPSVQPASYTTAPSAPQTGHTPPVLPPQIPQVYWPAASGNGGVVRYTPGVLGVAEVFYDSPKHKIATTQNYTILALLHEGPMALDWSEGERLDIELRELEKQPAAGAVFEECPKAAADVRSYDSWEKLLAQYIRTELSLTLLYSPTLKVFSQPEEAERDFLIRLQHLAHEQRDEDTEALRQKYDSKLTVLEDRHRRARQALEKQTSMASQRKMDAAVSAGTALLGALFGRRGSSVGRMGTAVRSTSRAFQSGEGIDRAEENLMSVEAQLDKMQAEIEQQIKMISEKYDMKNEVLEEIQIRPLSKNITIHFVGLAWRTN